MEEKTHATRCQSRRYAYLSHANAGIAAHPACWRPGSSAGMPDGVDRWEPAARVGDMAVCVGPFDLIITGSSTVLIGGKPAARMGDTTAHGGTIVAGCPTVVIGG